MKGYRSRIITYISCLLLCTAASAVIADIFIDSIILVMLLSSAIGLAVGALTVGIVLKPLTALCMQISALKKGDLSKGLKNSNLPIQKELDEAIGYIGFVVSDAAAMLQEVAQGNLTVNPSKDYRGDFKKLQSSLGYVFNAINANISDIACSANNVSSYSKQIHDTAQLLADNSTEQAVAIANLSHSMALVAERAMHSTKLAHSMVESGENVKQLAIVGAEHMDGMMQAVQEINDAGKSIEGVIKIIEDIAFQTNILALNAAVEAARAGQHGKGFAVVADEVRQLAGKSSVAAQKTNDLISDTMKKAGEGYSISLETRNSLEQILAGIQNVTDSIVEISKGSDTQEQEIKTVNLLLEDQAVAVQQSSSSGKTIASYGQTINENADDIRKMIDNFQFDNRNHTKIQNSILHIEDFKPADIPSDDEDSSIYKKLLWDDSLKMGDELIDGQHRQLIEMVDQLLAGCFNGTGAAEINKAMGFLLEYTVKHFADEEALQQRCSYPEYNRHKQIHDAFAAKAVGLAQELEKQGPTPEMIGLINKELVGWLLNHINGEDKKISRYLGNNA